MNKASEGQQQILVVDDLSENLKVLRGILTKQDYRVRVAINGTLALGTAKNNPPDLVLLDIRMPGMDGFEVCEQLKADDRTRDIPVMFLSASDDQEDKVRAFSLGGVDYITKPFQEAEVLARVRTHLQLQAQKTTLQAYARELMLAKESAQAAQKIAEQANTAKTVFLANMSHELRTPLNSILGYATILSRHPVLEVDTLDGLKIIYQSGRYLLTLINDLLDLTKIEAGRVELNPAELRLAQFLSDVIGIIQIQAREKNLRFTAKLDPQLPASILADETRLRQVLLNLLNNAVKFTDPGGIITLTIDNCRLNNRNSAGPADASPHSKTHIRFSITDTGVGMTKEQLKKIFLPFEQVGDLAGRVEGTGLGLAISKQLVKLMNSKIQVTSKPGQGSRFLFQAAFPVLDATYAVIPGQMEMDEIPEQQDRTAGYTAERRQSHLARHPGLTRRYSDKAKPVDTSIPLVMPPTQILDTLRTLADLYDYSGLETELCRLEQADVLYQPFVKLAREWARVFDMQSIQGFLREKKKSEDEDPRV